MSFVAPLQLDANSLTTLGERMSVLLLQELERNPDKVREDIWCYDNPDLVSDGLLERVSCLYAQLKVQKALQTTAKLLRQHPSNQSLPNQQATRVKFFMKFVLEVTNRGKERQARLRKLDCSSLKLCGLSYTLREVLELPSGEFDFLVENVADFIRRQTLLPFLYRDDVNRLFQGQFDPEDEELFKELQREHIEHRPGKRKRDGSPPLEDDEPARPPPSIQGRGPGTGYLTGDVYSLTVKDARVVAGSDEIEEGIWLTLPYHTKSSPFVTIPISKKLSEQFTTQRPQLM